jgi:hypothetical protein
MTRKTVAEPWCANGIRCVAYPALGEPSKLSRGNPGTRCFACEERRVVAELKTAANNKKAVEREKANHLRLGKGNGLTEQTEVGHAREVLERRRRSVRTCERGLRSALDSGDERLVRRWSRSLREAEDRLAWAETDFAKAEARMQSGRGR